jgi:diguanylate cyclase (GGDEF)-like protein
VTAAFSRPDQTRPIEVRVRLDGDSWRTITISAENRTADPGIRGIVFNLRGPEATVGADDQVTRTVMHDRVTDLPNRNLFVDRVEHAIARAGRSRNAVVVLAIDFSGFAGHDSIVRSEVDDSLLIAVAQRLRSCLRSGDTAARIGNDQFGVLLEDIAAPEHIDTVADRILDAMSVPFVGNGTEVTLTPHIGISVCNDGRCRAVDLVRDATIARAWARVQGAGSRVMFDPSMQPPVDEPATSEFQVIPPSATSAGLFERLDRLDERIASIEQRIVEIGKINV